MCNKCKEILRNVEAATVYQRNSSRGHEMTKQGQKRSEWYYQAL
jgi:hypothetical protein